MESYAGYDFKIVSEDGTWFYELYDPDYPELPAFRISSEWFETEQEARFAAIGHICLFKEGEG